jgi:hypothetical protein
MARHTVAARELDTLSTPFTVTHIDGYTYPTIDVERVKSYPDMVILVRTEEDWGPDVALRPDAQITVRY